MQLIRGIHNLAPEHRGCVATIGNFDGVHLGHQAVFGNLAAKGLALGLPTVVITFEPQPQEFFAPTQAPARLTRLREKLGAIQDAGVETFLRRALDAEADALRQARFGATEVVHCDHPQGGEHEH